MLLLRVVDLRLVTLRAPAPLPVPVVLAAPPARLDAALDRVEPEPLLVPPEPLVERDLAELDPERALLPVLREDELDEPDSLDFPRPVEERPEPPLELRDPELDEPVRSSVHLPDMTRCAASATASAISEPRRVALDMTELAALVALSAASRPASRILRRAAGLALIAAAAAASPAASISRLIAALASLSTVLSSSRDEPPEDDFPEEELFLPCLAIAGLPLSEERHFKAVTVPK